MIELTNDPFFRLTDDSEWNACIGSQSAEIYYVDGYLEAAILLVNELIDQQMHDKRDTLAMPILYNARHAIELMLKFVIGKLVQAGVLPAAPTVNHDIQAHCESLAQSALGDASLTQSVVALRPYVASLAAIDVDGQELRYAKNRDGNQSLADHSLVNLAVVKSSLKALNMLMTAMKYRVCALVEERETGTFTAECSRLDLMEISKMLPPRGDWSLPAFDEAKDRIKQRFSLSNKKFAKALDLIQGNREMGSRLGLEFPLAHLTDDHVVLVSEQWSLRHPPCVEKGIGIDYFTDRDWDDMKTKRKIAFKINAQLLAALSLEAIADLEVIFYIGRERLFSEWYDERLATTLRCYELDKTPQVALENLMGKMNLLTCVARGIAILGRPALADKLRALRPDLAAAECPPAIAASSRTRPAPGKRQSENTALKM